MKNFKHDSRHKILPTLSSLFFKTLLFAVLLLPIGGGGLTAQSLCSELGNLQPDLSLTNMLASQIATPPGSNGVLTGQVVFITGTLTVDIAFKFEDCVLHMAPDALIDVVTFAKGYLELDNCDIFSCNEMWEGIRVVPGSGITIHNGCRIEDAWVAVDVDNPKVVDITGSDFAKCDVGVHMMNVNAPEVQRLEGCTFNAAINGPFGIPQFLYENSPSFFTRQSTAAIWVENSSFVMIGGATGLNDIKACHQGIIVNNSIVNISNSHFNCWFSIINYANSGVGILAINNSHVTVQGLGKHGNATIEQYHKAGIKSDNSTVICRESHFERVRNFSFLAENTGNHHYDISNNSFLQGTTVHSPQSVIRARRGNILTDMITENHIETMDEMNGFNAVIHVFNNNSGITSEILRNELHMEGPIGIFSLNTTSGNTKINGNQIHLTGDAARGISVGWNVMGTPGDNNTIYGNIIEQGNFTMDFGISMFTSPFSLVCTNTLDEVQTGVRLIGNCMNTVVSENDFISNIIGLHLQGNGVNLGVAFNDHKANTWSGTFSSIAARHSGGDFMFSPFTVNNIPNELCEESDYFPNSNGTQSVAPASGWFFQEPDCEQWCAWQNSPPPGDDGDGLGLLDSAIINGQYYLTGQTPASVWHSEYTEYQKIKSNESYYQGNVLAASYLSAMDNSNIGKFYAFENKVAEAFHYSTTTRDSLEHHSYWIDSLMETLPDIYAAYAADTTNTTLANQYFQTAGELHYSKIRFEYWDSVSQVEKAAKLSEAATMLSQIVPLNLFETNLKTANSLRLTYFATDLTESEVAVADSLAYTCFDDAGPAINIAYSLLPDTLLSAEFPNLSCGGGSPQELIEDDLIFGNAAPISLYPNPTNGILKVQGLEPLDGQVTEGLIYDLYGRNISSHILFDGETRMDVGYLSPGIYYVKFMAGKNQLSTHRFIKTSR